MYQRVVGHRWARLDEQVRRVHIAAPSMRARGIFRVSGGRHWIARVLAVMLRLPRPNVAADIRLAVTTEGSAERWERTFDGRCFETRQSIGPHSVRVDVRVMLPGAGLLIAYDGVIALEDGRA